jgi:hypothetical protein
MHTCIYIYKYKCVLSVSSIQGVRYAYMHAYACIHMANVVMCSTTCTYTHQIQTYMYIYIYIHTYIHRQGHNFEHSRVFSLHIHTYMNQTYIHTYIHRQGHNFEHSRVFSWDGERRYVQHNMYLYT